jgi:hypothetical protein
MFSSQWKQENTDPFNGTQENFRDNNIYLPTLQVMYTKVDSNGNYIDNGETMKMSWDSDHHKKHRPKQLFGDLQSHNSFNEVPHNNSFNEVPHNNSFNGVPSNGSFNEVPSMMFKTTNNNSFDATAEHSNPHDLIPWHLHGIIDGRDVMNLPITTVSFNPSKDTGVQSFLSFNNIKSI